MVPPLILAYIDAGTGSMLFQGIIAGICVIAFFFRELKSWVMTHIFRRPKPEVPGTDQDHDQSQPKP